jgi:hypothetical protein
VALASPPRAAAAPPNIFVSASPREFCICYSTSPLCEYPAIYEFDVELPRGRDLPADDGQGPTGCGSPSMSRRWDRW